MRTLRITTDELALDLRKFLRICADNPDLWIEWSRRTTLVIRPEESLEHQIVRNFLQASLWQWARERHRAGELLGPFEMVNLGDAGIRRADVGFFRQRGRFSTPHSLRSVPNFAVVFRGENERYIHAYNRAADFLEAGSELCWMTDLVTETVYILRQDGTEEFVQGFSQHLTGEDILPNFLVDLRMFNIDAQDNLHFADPEQHDSEDDRPGPPHGLK